MRNSISGTVPLLALVASLAAAGTTRAADGNVEDGADVFKKCRACHKVGADAGNLVGPHLNGIVGRKASSVEGFKYSPASHAASEKGLVWTEEALMKYLENPSAFMPGTAMAFAGLKDEQDRRDVIAYLKTFK